MIAFVTTLTESLKFVFGGQELVSGVQFYSGNTVGQFAQRAPLPDVSFVRGRCVGVCVKELRLRNQVPWVLATGSL